MNAAVESLNIFFIGFSFLYVYLPCRRAIFRFGRRINITDAAAADKREQKMENYTNGMPNNYRRTRNKEEDDISKVIKRP